MPEVKWLFEDQSREGCVIVSTSDPIPRKGHRGGQERPAAASAGGRTITAASSRTRTASSRSRWKSRRCQRPKPLVIEITAAGVSLLLAAPTAIGIATSRPARAG